MRLPPALTLAVLAASLAPPVLADDPASRPLPLDRRGRAIVVCGEKVDIGTPVILWTDPGGHDAYAPKAKPAADKKAGSPGFRARRGDLPAAEQERLRKDGWTRPALEQVVDQFVLHYDVCGTSGKCFEVLHERDLAVHFMLDLDGTIYQTLDLKEAAFHATKANDRSIGIEIANMGAYPVAELGKSPLATWYAKGPDGTTQIRLPRGHSVPTRAADAPPLAPSRPEPVVGTVQGQELAMYDLTAEQYAALAKLTAGLCRTFPKIHPDLPRDAQGKVLDHKLDDPAYNQYQGILGHFHVQQNKTDPGPAFRWDAVLHPPRP